MLREIKFTSNSFLYVVVGEITEQFWKRSKRRDLKSFPHRRKNWVWIFVLMFDNEIFSCARKFLLDLAQTFVKDVPVSKACIVCKPESTITQRKWCIIFERKAISADWIAENISTRNLQSNAYRLTAFQIAIRFECVQNFVAFHWVKIIIQTEIADDLQTFDGFTFIPDDKTTWFQELENIGKI